MGTFSQCHLQTSIQTLTRHGSLAPPRGILGNPTSLGAFPKQMTLHRLAIGIRTGVFCLILTQLSPLPLFHPRSQHGGDQHRERPQLTYHLQDAPEPPGEPDFHRLPEAQPEASSPPATTAPGPSCIKCAYCGLYLSPNKFIFHSHRTPTPSTRIQHKLGVWQDRSALGNKGGRAVIPGGQVVSTRHPG
uniref:c-SKI SMAD4-binding domain-containing protein n=1 Tax=Xenopus tropicalis TaxID=8364 RepID=A0A803JPM1_XENTR